MPWFSLVIIITIKVKKSRGLEVEHGTIILFVQFSLATSCAVVATFGYVAYPSSLWFIRTIPDLHRQEYQLWSQDGNHNYRNAVIGDGVKIRHHITIGSGAASTGNDVEFGAGVKVIGNVQIGHGAKIGANAVVVDDIPEGVLAIGIPARTVQKSITHKLKIYHESAQEIK